MTTDRLDALVQENALLRRAVIDHPAANTLRYVAPLIRDAITAGVWPQGTGTDAVERELASALSWLQRAEGAA